MKLLSLSFFLLAAAALSNCAKPTPQSHAEPPPENGAQFRKGEGIALTDEMKQALDLKIVEVTEQKIAPAFTVPLHVMPGHALEPVALTKDKATSGLASGWISAEQAALIKPGMAVELRREETDAAVETGTVSRVEKMGYATLGDYEIEVSTAKPLPEGSLVLATFRIAESKEVASIPRSALLKTAEGTFAYTVNGKFHMRTPVKVGVMNEQTVEITEGLYAGDEVVASPVMSLWMAELQVLRGGKACTCGH